MKLGSVDISRLYIGGTEITKAYLGAVEVYANSQPWDVSTATFVQVFSLNLPVGSPSGMFFKSDGLKLFISDSDDFIHEFVLATAWDVSTASLVQSADVSAQDSIVTDVFFKSDGLKMYITGTTFDRVYEYNLSVAWDISTSSFAQSLDLLPEVNNPEGLSFKSDGLKMFIVSSADDAVHEFTLSSAWDVSTASHIQSFSISSQDISPRGLFVRQDGLKMYISGAQDRSVDEYDLATPWDVSTASFVQGFIVLSEQNNPLDVFLKPDGTRMYITGNSPDAVHEYNLGGA